MLSNETPPLSVVACAVALHTNRSRKAARTAIQGLLNQPKDSLGLEDAKPIELAAIFSRAVKTKRSRSPYPFDLLNALIEHLGVDQLVKSFSDLTRRNDAQHFAVFLNAVIKGDTGAVQSLLHALNQAGLLGDALANPNMSPKHLAFLFKAIGMAGYQDKLELLGDPRAQTAFARILREGCAPERKMASEPVADFLELQASIDSRAAQRPPSAAQPNPMASYRDHLLPSDSGRKVLCWNDLVFRNHEHPTAAAGWHDAAMTFVTSPRQPAGPNIHTP